MLIIRADGNANIGAGHVMRCISIAKQAQKYTDVKFICSDRASANLVSQHGFLADSLDVESFSLMDALGTAMRLKAGDIILIDSYAVDNDYISAFPKDVTVAVMDDMCNLPLTVNKVINYNAFADEAKYERLYSGKKLPKLILGADYIPVRDEFIENSADASAEVTDIFVTTGGGDNDNIAGDIVNALENHVNALNNVTYHVICGAYNPNYDILASMAEKYGNIVLYKNVDNMAELMSKCQVGITAGGSTIYEMCAVGLPFVCFAYAANQLGLVHFVRNGQFSMYAGKFMSSVDSKKPYVIQTIADKVIEMAENVNVRTESVVKGRSIVDGKGAERLAKALLEVE